MINSGAPVVHAEAEDRRKAMTRHRPEPGDRLAPAGADPAGKLWVNPY